ncbi:Gfo/Idh/MocA family protein [Tichowtungia aerotolerans]|uniref:Gfo/Idh/MocA family oxidoreductase n=1 Tax=Tichowtungia aerotolerans TaxID=2697043 RepID=A0A6P1MD70_9BACT|nr:Gfo/Idh/MocA family oxidoreductase [Tichowtungia aerotolerans]QHI69045.1 Gfo/Idh/MocA family oxidoreductase [Tichowtungia aerotolerans]
MKFIILGAGSRGSAYARHILENKDRARVVAVAEPDPVRRSSLADLHGVGEENRFSEWKEVAEKDRFADAVVIAVQDDMHLESTLAFLKKGYHVLLEKPLAPSVEDCCRIYMAAKASGVLFAVCHVLRYTTYTAKMKTLLDQGVIGDIVSMQHLEPVGYYHQAHSFVRGNWRNEKMSSPMLLAKACHDLDWIRYIMDSRCESITSFGNLRHFKIENAPENSAERCLDCACETECPYSAKKIYIKRAEAGDLDWPNRTITNDLTLEGVRSAIETGPYGRCVYRCDNDVVDHQVVNMLFEDGRTASFTMTAFTDMVGRKTRVFGTKGCMEGDQDHIKILDFLTDEEVEIETSPEDSTILGGHGGGDKGLIDAFINAVETGDRSQIISGAEETIESHMMVFAAERSRRERAVVNMREFTAEHLESSSVNAGCKSEK